MIYCSPTPHLRTHKTLMDQSTAFDVFNGVVTFFVNETRKNFRIITNLLMDPLSIEFLQILETSHSKIFLLIEFTCEL